MKLLIIMNLLFLGAIILAAINITMSGPAEPIDIITIGIGMAGIMIGNVIALRKARAKQ